VNVLGIDPGMAAFGVAVVDLSANKVLRLDVIETAKSDKKRGVRASDDNLRRAQEIVVGLKKIIRSYDSDHVMPCGHYGGTSFAAICAESMSFPRNSSSSAKIGYSWGIIATIADHLGLPIVQASPQEIKKTLCGRKDASKDDVEDAVRALYVGAKVEARIKKSFHNHAWDALSAVASCMESDVLKLAMRLDGGSTRRGRES